jgi:shikimate dehydrogenase
MRMHFIGVTTAQSAMQRIFPLWMAQLGIPQATLRGVDLPLGASPEAYRRAVLDVRDDPQCAGALVTSHKIGVYEAGAELFEPDPYGALCGELNGISKRDSGARLLAHAKDPLAARAALEAFVGPQYFAQNKTDVVCFGSGGAATAIAVQFTAWPVGARPARIVMVDRRTGPLKRLRAIVEPRSGGIEFHFQRHSDAAENDALLRTLPPGALVINATGMGKDLPGSPLTARAVFPQAAAVWELNYRGELLFLAQARAQQAGRALRVQDGWVYFLHGWTKVIEEVYQVSLGPEMLPLLSAIAVQHR